MADLSPVTPDHAMHFGYVMELFAKNETNIMIAAAGILNTDLGTAVILMGDMNYRQKSQTLRHLNTTRGIDGKISSELEQLLADLHRQSKLRNAISHCIWVTGRRPGSIKPMQLILRRKTPRAIGHDHNETDYTVDDLRAAARKLNDIARRFNEFLDSSGLSERLQANIEAIRASTDSSPG